MAVTFAKPGSPLFHRLIFVLVDCLPVVVKFSGGVSEYDKVFRAQSGRSVQEYERDMDVLRDQEDADLRRRRTDLDLDLQQHRAQARVGRAAAVDKVASHLLATRGSLRDHEVNGGPGRRS